MIVFKIEVEKVDGEFTSLQVLDDQSAAPKTTDQTSDDLANERFATLGKDWTQLAISFLKVVPTLSSFGFMLADKEFGSKAIALLEKAAINKEEKFVDGKELIIYSVEAHSMPPIVRKLNDGTRYFSSARMLRQAAFTALIAEYEHHIAKLLKIAIGINPKIILNDESVVPIKYFDEAKSLEDLREKFISEKIDQILHNKSHMEMIDWVQDSFNINAKSDVKLISEFVEICQRRHLISHAGGIANRRYIEICNKAGCKGEYFLKQGERADISIKYLRRATARVFQVGYFLLQLIWQKIVSSPEKPDLNVLGCSHDFLENDLTKMAKRLAEFPFARKSNKPSGRVEAYLIINLAQSEKFNKDMVPEERIKKMEQALSQRDWTEKSPMIDLILSVLRDDFSEFQVKLDAARKYGDHKLKLEDIYHWNVFRDVRKEPRLIEIANGVFVDKPLQLP
jgi:hypothetical protein